MPRFLLLAIVVLAALAGAARPAAGQVPASAPQPMTFHLTVAEALASVGRTNALLALSGKQGRGLKIVPGGTKFAGLTCAGFGNVYELASVTVLDGPQAFPDLVTTKKGKDAQALATAFGLAGTTPWQPPATDAET